MGRITVGHVVSITFPFLDLLNHKKRPALVVAQVDFGDLILCQITSKPYTSTHPIPLQKSDFVKGGLPLDSYIRPDKLFTADPSIVDSIQGMVKPDTLHTVHAALRNLFV
ncbi:MAG TPA: type II toxin-antitoxin system PemK/MazF family toxin [Candidatus Saccharimonadales bacterium]|nr:type II toxin-antitoxin system PemK/MazF family toxin [Candidatus Saccharimonadales bacterium]